MKEISTTWTPAFFPVWSNEAFAGDHKAKYCQGSDNRVYIVLKSPPDICTTVVFASTYPVPSATGIPTGNISSAVATTSPPKSTIISASVPSSSNATNATSTSINQVARATSIIEAHDYQSFCSRYLGYTTPITTSTVTANSTVTARSTLISGVLTTSVNATYNTTETIVTSTETDVTTPTSYYTTITTVISTTTEIDYVGRKREEPKPSQRGAAHQSNSTGIPVSLLTFSPSILSSACSLEATKPSVISTDLVTATRNQTTQVIADKPSSTATITSTSTRTLTLSQGVTTTTTTAPIEIDVTTSTTTAVTTQTSYIAL